MPARSAASTTPTATPTATTSEFDLTKFAAAAVVVKEVPPAKGLTVNPFTEMIARSHKEGGTIFQLPPVDATDKTLINRIYLAIHKGAEKAGRKASVRKQRATVQDKPVIVFYYSAITAPKAE